MKRRKGKGKTRKGGVRKPKPLLGLMPSVNNVQKAVMVETYQPTVLIQPNISTFFSVTISNYPRAIKMAQLFKFYRAKRVIFEYMPDSNIYQAGNGNIQIPYFYYTMNRDGCIGLNTKAEFLACGARPIKFTKKVMVSYKPNLAQTIDLLQLSQIPPGSNQNVTIGRRPIYDQWISTEGIVAQDANYVAGTQARADGSIPPYQQPANNLSVVQYFGHNCFFEQQGPAETSLGYFSITVEWEFKVPNVYLPETNA